jgi:hypothetical protein
MKTDAELQQDVMNELIWEPTIKAAAMSIAMLRSGPPSVPPHEFLVSGQWLKKLKSGCPALLRGQMRISPGR